MGYGMTHSGKIRKMLVKDSLHFTTFIVVKITA